MRFCKHCVMEYSTELYIWTAVSGFRDLDIILKSQWHWKHGTESVCDNFPPSQGETLNNFDIHYHDHDT